MSLVNRWSLSLICVALLMLTGCGGDDETAAPPAPDGLPAVVTDLHASAGTPSSITLAWTAPPLDRGDDPVAAYELRRAELGQEEGGWDAWTPVAGLPDPAAPGTAQQATIAGLDPASTHLFRLRATVDGTTWSGLSNLVVASADPSLDTAPPAPVTDLVLRWRSGDAVRVAWSATGDDGVYGRASGYEVRYAPEPVTAANWDAATVAPAPEAGAGGETWTCTVDGLEPPGGTVHLAVRAVDDQGLWSPVSASVGAPPPQGTVWRIAVDGSGTVPTIREAVDLAQPGDVILVGPGRYTWTNQGGPHNAERMIFLARGVAGIALIGEAGPAATILDAEGQGTVLFAQAENDDVVIEGFTITGGVGEVVPDPPMQLAGGLTFHLTDVVVRNCVFTGNAGGQGGAIYYGGRGHPVLEDCLITGNTASLIGGGVFLVNSPGDGGEAADHVTLRRCTITGNTSASLGGGVGAYNIVVALEECLIADNGATDVGGGLYLAGHGITEDPTARSTAVRCTIAGNTAPEAAAIRVTSAEDRHGTLRPGQLELTACLIADNGGGPAVAMRTDAHLAADCCDLFGAGGHGGWPAEATLGEGNLALDPRFCDAAGGDYHVDATSPCAAGNHPQGLGCGPIGALGVGCGR